MSIDQAAGPAEGTTAGSCPMRGPKGLPVLGVAPRYFKDPLRFTLETQEEYGAIVPVPLPVPFVQITAPAAIERVLRTNPDNYRRGTLYQGFLSFMGKGLLTLDHADWRPRRKVVQPGFAPRRIEQGAAEAVPATEATLRRWTGLAAAGRPVNVADDLMDISARVIGKALVSRDLSEPGVGYSRAAAIVSKVMYTEATKGVNSLLPGWLPTRYHRERKWAHGVLDAIVGRVLARRATNELGDDVATLMLEAGLPDQAIGDDLRTLLLAGSDTTGQALAWTLYELARHPQARREVEEEVDRVLADGPPHPGMLDQLPVTRSAIDEALRLHPPVWQFPRDAIADDELDGCPVRAGSTVLMSIYGTHRSPEQWDDPDTFDPARFRGDWAKDRHRFAYFPFGGGRRLCIGRPLALGTLTIAVAMISHRFRLMLSDAHPVESASYITLFPRDGLTATVVERR